MASKCKYWLACFAAIGAQPVAPAAAEPRSINVPSEEAARSIPEFARQENIQIVAPVSQLHGINTPAVAGSMELDEALAALLVGTGLEVASNDGMTIVLRRAPPPAPVFGGIGPIDTGPVPTEFIVVTGSRVISDAENSPTPITAISSDALRDTTPTNLPDGLNKLPIFQGSQTTGRTGDGSTNAASNVLNLRNFGVQRTLVLMDGHRVTPSNADGTVDIDSLPQLLVTRVDIVTGGASAVYGSDAVTGVVNFVLDKNFNGLKFEANSGVSNFGDSWGYRVGAAGGTDVLGGWGHLEGSVEYRHKDGILVFDRPAGAAVPVNVGTGTQANPYYLIFNARRPNSSAPGKVQGCVPACPAASGQQFVADGVLGPFAPGIAGGRDAAGNVTAGTRNQNSGGDGAYTPYSTALAPYRQGTAFGRFSYDLSSDVTGYVEATASQASTRGWWFPMKLTPGAGQADLFYKDNPFLPAAVQSALGNDGTHPLQNAAASPALQPGNTFQLGKFLTGLGKAESNGATSVNRVLSMQAGLDGSLGSYNWNLFYTHGENRLAVDLTNNQNYQKLYAASDSVQLPDGSIKCYAATQAATALQYADCVPLNPFGPTALTWDAFRYFAQTTNFHQTFVMDNLGGALSGRVWDGWAGPVNAALSAEWRNLDYTVTTNAPIANVDCTGLRLCSSSLPLYAQPVLAPLHVSDNVWEVALEAEIPLLKNAPVAQSFDLNLAGRYTDYSTSGAVETWKAGFDWKIVDALRLRGTTSIDIRAPSLSDLHQPAMVAVTGFTDIHTATANTTFNITQGNPNLTPEISRTYTIGAVWTPGAILGLTMSLDYFRIHMKNAISKVAATSNSIQELCESSGGISQYCALYRRPQPFADRTPANYPTSIYTLNMNTASIATEGFDFETNYAWRMSDIVDGWEGLWNARFLATYQPVILESTSFPGAARTRTASPQSRFTAFLNYRLGNWTLGLQDSWQAGFNQYGQPPQYVNGIFQQQYYVDPHVEAFNQLDVNVTRAFTMAGTRMSAYVVIENLLDRQPDIVGGALGNAYPAPAGQSIMGRYYTIGIRARL